MTQIYHKKIKNTTNESIRYFYYNKKTDSIDELNFLNKKIDSLLNSKIVSDNTKNDLFKLKAIAIDFNKFNSFYIYSNKLRYAIDDKFVYLYDKNFYELFKNKVNESQIKVIKLKFTKNSPNSNESIDDDDLPKPSESNNESNDDE